MQKVHRLETEIKYDLAIEIRFEQKVGRNIRTADAKEL